MEHTSGTEIEAETAFDGTENEKMTPETYSSYCRGVLWEVHSHSNGMDLSGDSIESYTVGELSWKAGELSKRLHSKNLLNLLGEGSATGDKGCGDDCQRTIYITLKGKRKCPYVDIADLQ